MKNPHMKPTAGFFGEYIEQVGLEFDNNQHHY